MGLDFSHGDVYFSYGKFHVFRSRLAEEIGMDYSKMDGLRSDGKKGLSWEPFGDLSKGILPLLNHSDCDGELTIDEMREVVPALRELTKAWFDDDWCKIRAIKLAEAMEEAISMNEPLEFQ